MIFSIGRSQLRSLLGPKNGHCSRNVTPKGVTLTDRACISECCPHFCPYFWQRAGTENKNKLSCLLLSDYYHQVCSVVITRFLDPEPKYRVIMMHARGARGTCQNINPLWDDVRHECYLPICCGVSRLLNFGNMSGEFYVCLLIASTYARANWRNPHLNNHQTCHLPLKAWAYLECNSVFADAQ